MCLLCGGAAQSNEVKTYSLEALADMGMTEERWGWACEPGLPFATHGLTSLLPLDSSGEYSPICLDNHFNWLVFKGWLALKNVFVKSRHFFLLLFFPLPSFPSSHPSLFFRIILFFQAFLFIFFNPLRKLFSQDEWVFGRSLIFASSVEALEMFKIFSHWFA